MTHHFSPGVRCRLWAVALFTAAAWCAPAARAVDLGNIGPVYPVQEQSVLELITQRLKVMEKSGELARRQRAIAERHANAIRQPAPIPGLSTGRVARSSLLDPSVVLERDLVDQNGRVLFPAGTRKNPLDIVTLTRKLVFFDGRDARQVARARDLMARLGPNVKPVLVGGSYLELMKQWKVPVYFDQQGVLVRRFQITQVPALVYQEGRMLRIDQLETLP